MTINLNNTQKQILNEVTNIAKDIKTGIEGVINKVGHFELEADWKANIAVLKYLKPEIEDTVIDDIKGKFDHIVTTYKNWDKKCRFMMVGFGIGLLVINFFAIIAFTSQLSAFVFAIGCGGALFGLTYKGLKNITDHKNNEILKASTDMINELDKLVASTI